MAATMLHKAALESAVHSALQDALGLLHSDFDITWFDQTAQGCILTADVHSTNVAFKVENVSSYLHELSPS